jgi:hypothetical protein
MLFDISFNEISNYLKDFRKKAIDGYVYNYNTFNKRSIFTIENVLDRKICEWIIFESEEHAKINGGWNRYRHEEAFTTDIQIKKIKNLSNFITNFVIMNIFPAIEKYTNFEKLHLVIRDLFVVKYSHEAQNELEIHRDGSTISFNILLNEKTEFDGGGTIFKLDSGDSIYNINRGDMLLHCGRIEHGGVKIKRGVRYILIGFIGYLDSYSEEKKIWI